MQPNRLPVLFAVILLVLLAASTASAAPDACTILDYLDGDSNLDVDAINEFNEM